MCKEQQKLDWSQKIGLYDVGVVLRMIQYNFVQNGRMQDLMLCNMGQYEDSVKSKYTTEPLAYRLERIKTPGVLCGMTKACLAAAARINQYLSVCVGGDDHTPLTVEGLAGMSMQYLYRQPSRC